MRETTIYNTNNTFGGKLSNYSFDGHSTMREIAENIISDMKFDEHCKKNIELIRDGKKTKLEKETK